MAHEYTSSSGRSEIQDDLDSLKDDLANLRDDLGELMKSFVAAGRSRVGDVRKRMQGEIKEQIDRLGEQRGKAVHAVQQQIEGHPMVTIGAAFGLGLLLGVLLSRP